MKRTIRSIILTVILAALVLLGVTACAGKGGNQEPQGNNPPAVTQEASEGEQQSQTPSKQEEPSGEQQTSEQQTSQQAQTEPQKQETTDLVEEGEWYYDKDHVAAYIDQFGELPGNYMTKKEARKLGWSGGSLERYAEGRVIGGDVFGNREGLLPDKSGRTYYECEIDTLNRSERGAKRIIFSDDGLIYYTDDHYRSFTLLYGEE